jgi:glycine betaine/choline ABC-type transport system substrate-binding protein
MDRKKTLALLIVTSLLAGCSSPHRLTVGSKNFTEQLVLGEILAQQIERRLQIKVERKLNLGGTLLAQQALESGQIDLFPEYTGTAVTNVLKLPPSADAAAVLAQVRSEYRRRWNIEWLDPFGFNNSFAMVIRGEEARRGKLETLTEAARYKSNWIMGAGYEFLQRPDGFPGLVTAYGLSVKGTPASMDLGLLYQALGQRQVEMVAASATDGMLSVLDVKALRDDRGYFPPYEAAPLVRADALAAFPGLRAALQELAGAIPTATMQRLNYQVDGKHRAVAEVAAEFLKAH